MLHVVEIFIKSSFGFAAPFVRLRTDQTFGEECQLFYITGQSLNIIAWFVNYSNFVIIRDFVLLRVPLFSIADPENP